MTSAHDPRIGAYKAAGGPMTPRNDAEHVSGVADGSEAILADTLDAWLADHRAKCEVGPRACIDCALAGAREFRSGIVAAAIVAKAAKEALAGITGSCVYCGDYATSRDHLLPRGWTGKAARRFVPTVPSCQDCNARIGEFPDYGIAQRAEVVARSLRKRFSKELSIVDMSDVEIRSFGVHLRTALIAKRDFRRALRRRLTVLDLGGMPSVPDHYRKELAA